MSSYQVYLWKPWVNHSKNSAEGLTVTVPATTGVLVVAAPAVLVSLAGDSAWTITSFALHQLRSRTKSQDGMSRMLQVILRNPGNAVGSCVEILQTGHIWNDRVISARIRAGTLAIWPFAINTAFLAAGVFVARITVAAFHANVVLLESTNCGVEFVGDVANLGAQITVANQQVLAKRHSGMLDLRGTESAAHYADECLVNNIYAPALPDTQWPLETTKWFQTSLANIQHRIVDYPNNNWATNRSDLWKSNGPSFGVVDPRIYDDTGSQAFAKQCGSQLVRSANEHQSFIVVGVVVVVVISFAWIITSWTLHLCVSKRKDRQLGARKRHKLLAYIADSKTHLAHTSLRGAGYTGWDLQMHSMPVREVEDYRNAEDIEAVVESNGVIWQPGPRHGAVEYNQELLRTDTSDEKCWRKWYHGTCISLH
ncbi:hypothetical protein Slin15195_G016280 [Septoria linicola]|uniref:Transmembrane protein n=1 Tax=Septoria linicola TaxID=215465 RepID=A0A9Q9AIB8_9PEZI|nr:hypothetical protein Slin14017_G016340 [Septoria linicola]USW48309.1 hypothetical protein Slin15195_G016280 [Septoria linicola]